MPTTQIATSVRVCRTEEIGEGLARSFDIAGRQIAIFRTRSGSFHAIDNACPHAGAPLADGLLTGSCVVCPFHARRIDLQTGQCGDGSMGNVNTYPLTITDGWITLNLPPE